MENTVATTILAQLGGNRFIMMMTGAKMLTSTPNSLGFRIGRNDKGVNYVRVRLNAKDTYDVEFLSLQGLNSTVKAYREDIYADQLQEVFTRETGMYTSMGTMGRTA